MGDGRDEGWEERRRERQRRMTVRVVTRGSDDEEDDDPSDLTTPAERIALVWQLTRETWSLTGRPFPSYARADMPVRAVSRAEADSVEW